MRTPSHIDKKTKEWSFLSLKQGVTKIYVHSHRNKTNNHFYYSNRELEKSMFIYIETEKVVISIIEIEILKMYMFNDI